MGNDALIHCQTRTSGSDQVYQELEAFLTLEL